LLGEDDASASSVWEVLLFYKAEAPKRWTCAVVKRTNDEACLVTAYPTDAIKEGVRIWPN
jgi:hypothetical protein